MQVYTDYGYQGELVPQAAEQLLGPIEALCGELSPAVRILELGSGKGFFAGWLAAHGCTVVGVEEDREKLEVARRRYPAARFEARAVSPDLLGKLGEPPFDIVLSSRNIAAWPDPGELARFCYGALRPGGRLICAAPYSGYITEVARAVASRLDRPARQGESADVQLWNRKSLSRLLSENGFTNIQFRGAGRVPFLSPAMLMAGDRPLERAAEARREVRPLVA